jgi:preprotein translocase subunit SecF
MTDAALETAPRKDSLFRRVFGEGADFDFVGQSRKFLIISVVLLILVGIGTLINGLNFSIEFTGGSGFTVVDATREFTTEELRDAISETGVEGSIVQVVDDGAGALVSTPALEEIGGEQQDALIAAIAETTGVAAEDIDVSAVGPRWGAQITRQSIRGLIVFLVLVSLYLALRFEWRMAAAAILTLLHDIVLSIGVYAVVGFTVSPASVIAFLTILGYSLYDTVIVFDRVKEDTAGLSSVSTRTYGDAANAALNEVLVRSLSTSISALLPVGSLLFIGATLLGAETLKDLALALFIGMAIGTYSSVVIATPFLVWLKEKEPKWRELKERVESRRSAPPEPTPAKTAPVKPQTSKSTASKPKRRR